MVCTYAGQIIMGGCLELHIAPWKRVAFTRVFALGPSLAVAASTYNNQKLVNNINEYLNVLQSVQLPFAMLPVLHFTASKKLLGGFRSGPCFMGLSVVLALLVISVNALLVVQFIQVWPIGGVIGVILYGILYTGVCIRMVWDDLCAIARLLTATSSAEGSATPIVKVHQSANNLDLGGGI